MGRIKTQLIKRLTFQLIKLHKEKLKDLFDDNKKVVDSYLGKPGKVIRNKVAGYVTRLMKHKEDL